MEQRSDEPLAALKRDIVAVSENYELTDLLNTLMQRKEHMAVVLDDFGGMAGIVTLEDVIETILGMEIVDETDTTTDMRELAESLREKRGKVLGALEATGQQPSQKPQSPSED